MPNTKEYALNLTALPNGNPVLNKRTKMNDLVLAAKAADWYKLKALVLDSVSSPITRRVYNMALVEFMAWFRLEPRPGFSKATVSAWRARPLNVFSVPGRISRNSPNDAIKTMQSN